MPHSWGCARINPPERCAGNDLAEFWGRRLDGFRPLSRLTRWWLREVAEIEGAEGVTGPCASASPASGTGKLPHHW
jgi:hypothetical protein